MIWDTFYETREEISSARKMIIYLEISFFLAKGISPLEYTEKFSVAQFFIQKEPARIGLI